MSDQINHECGIALIRLLKPLQHYKTKYGTSFYGLRKLHLLMQKQHNRGQDGAGIACIKFDMEPGNKYINRFRSNSSAPIVDVFNSAFSSIKSTVGNAQERYDDINWLKKKAEFTGELFLGHLRYGTFGTQGVELLHPVIRTNNWKTRTLVLAGNFNLTNVDELFEYLIDLGQYPIETSDTITILEKIGHYLDEENEAQYRRFKQEGYQKREITPLLGESINLNSVLNKSARDWDGGYTIAGMIGHGDAFAMRDPSGIRPAFYYHDDEVAVVASERPVIQTALGLTADRVKELDPGHAFIVKRNGAISLEPFKTPAERRACSFERIYFSRGTDKDIYKERKALGSSLAPAILKAIDHDLENTVFSYIPNTASVAFRGLAEELDRYCNRIKRERIIEAGPDASPEDIGRILDIKPRIEKVAVKDVKLRTFITQDSERDDLVGHVYDITYGSLRPGVDNLVVLDDSIVRGTTLKKSIIRILDRLGPKKIVIASSAPQIRYPDCYGIDMAKLHDFIAFQAAIALLKESNQSHIINEVYAKAKAQQNLPKEQIVNHITEIYKPLSAPQISAKIAEMLTSPGINAKIEVIYQKIEDLHAACPNHRGDWYFTGNYPTPGGNKVVNRAFINYIEGRDVRAY